MHRRNASKRHQSSMVGPGSPLHVDRQRPFTNFIYSTSRILDKPSHLTNFLTIFTKHNVQESVLVHRTLREAKAVYPKGPNSKSFDAKV